MPFIARGGSADVTVPSGQSIIIGSLGAGTTTIFKQYGGGNFPTSFVFQQYLSQGQVTLGPYTNGALFRVNASLACDIEYEVGVNPQLTAGGSGGPVGTFANTTLLQAAFPAAANAGRTALVGSSAPYTNYTSDGSAWNAAGAGAVASVAGKTGAVTLATTDLTDGTALNTALNNKFALPTTNYNAATNTPAITQGQPLMVSGNRVFSVLCTVGSSSSAGPFSTVNFNDTLADDGSGTWHRVAGVSSSGKIQKSDGQTPAGLADAGLGVDYGAPITIQNGIEIYRAPSGTMGNNGAVTLGTALPAALPDGCWMEFPAGAIASGIPSSAQVTAGVKLWTVMSSTTAGTVYNNTYTPGTNSQLAPPASPVAFSTTGPGAFTNNTSASIAYSVTVPANTLGPHGSIDYEIWCSSNNSAGSKTVSALFGGAGAGANVTMTTGVQQALLGNVMNKGYTNRQKSSQAGKSFSGNQSKNTSSVDTTAPQTFNINFNAAVAGDYVCIESLKLTITGAP